MILILIDIKKNLSSKKTKDSLLTINILYLHYDLL